MKSTQQEALGLWLRHVLEQFVGSFWELASNQPVESWLHPNNPRKRLGLIRRKSLGTFDRFAPPGIGRRDHRLPSLRSKTLNPSTKDGSAQAQRARSEVAANRHIC